jgi:hypothetical protein
MRLQPRRVEARTFCLWRCAPRGWSLQMCLQILLSAVEQRDDRRGPTSEDQIRSHLSMMASAGNGARRFAAGPQARTVAQVVTCCCSGGTCLPRRRPRQTNLCVEPAALNSLWLCPAPYSVRFGGWKVLCIRLVPEGGVALRRNLARLAGFRAKRNETFRLQKTVMGAVASGLGIVGFPTCAWVLGRKIVPLGIELRRRSAFGSPTAWAAVLFPRWATGPCQSVQDSRGLRANWSIQANLKQYIRKAESPAHLFGGFSTEGR